MQKVGCLDGEYSSNESSGDVVSEFSSTLGTSVESTPEPSPVKKPEPNPPLRRGLTCTKQRERFVPTDETWSNLSDSS